jgi:pimeloyl-ACP methyl ester carboxylesterase
VPERPQMGGRPKKYPDRETALARFRLQPPQTCENQYILDYVARHSLLPVDGGWTWKFDDDLPNTLKGAQRLADEYTALRCKVGVIYGERSELFSKRTLEYMRELIPQPFPAVAIADAQHHVFLDQPEAFVAALREMLKTLTAR